jgi:hypothetical protein
MQVLHLFFESRVKIVETTKKMLEAGRQISSYMARDHEQQRSG